MALVLLAGVSLIGHLWLAAGRLFIQPIPMTESETCILNVHISGKIGIYVR